MKERIVLIGAGSAMFTRGLVADLIRAGVEAELALVDVDPAALEVAAKLAAKMFAARQAPIALSASVDRREVLPRATVVICTVGVGGRRAWERDVVIPRTFGIYVPVGDTVGPGGTSRALRMIPAMVDVARDVLDLAPDAGAYTCDGPPNNFVDLILGKAAVNWSPGEAAMRSVLLLDAAYRSAASGRPETV